jgi:hypothetical protein
VGTHDWLASDECRRELDLAVDCGKRVVSVQPRRLGWIEVPPGLDGRSPIGFWREAGHAKALDALEKTLVEDHAWLTAHRDLLVDASRWERSDGQDVRLGGEVLRAAVRLVERASVGLVKPDLVAVQRAYVRACESSTRSGSGRRR